MTCAQHRTTRAAGDIPGPRRRCVASRTEQPCSDLVRFVADPMGLIVPDLEQKLPGRGVWVTGERAAVEEAIRLGAFARSLKRHVVVPPGLADTVGALMVKRAMQALSLANKAGVVITGFAQVESSLDGGDVAALLHGADAALGGKEKLDRKLAAIFREREVPPIICALTISQLSLALGRTNVVHAALGRSGATARFVVLAQRLDRYGRSK